MLPDAAVGLADDAAVAVRVAHSRGEQGDGRRGPDLEWRRAAADCRAAHEGLVAEVDQDALGAQCSACARRATWTAWPVPSCGSCTTVSTDSGRRAADLVGLMAEDHDDVGRRRRCASGPARARSAVLPAEPVQHLVAARTHPRALASRQHDRHQAAGTWRVPRVSWRVHDWSEIDASRGCAPTGCPARTRTWIDASKVRCPTVGRPGIVRAVALKGTRWRHAAANRCARVLTVRTRVHLCHERRTGEPTVGARSVATCASANSAGPAPER